MSKDPNANIPAVGYTSAPATAGERPLPGLSPASTISAKPPAAPSSSSSSLPTKPIPPKATIHPTSHLDPSTTTTGTHPITLHSGTLISPRCLLNSSNGPLSIGPDVLVCERVCIGTTSARSSSSNTENPAPGSIDDSANTQLETVIGEGVRLASQCTIEAGAQIHAYATIGEKAVVKARATVGKGAKVCAGAVVGDGVKVGEGIVVMPGGVRRRMEVGGTGAEEGKKDMGWRKEREGLLEGALMKGNAGGGSGGKRESVAAGR
ncbi:MAG: hypothetical protein Q9227_000980 [Pyrenula ochraceoflavens]